MGVPVKAKGTLKLGENIFVQFHILFAHIHVQFQNVKTQHNVGWFLDPILKDDEGLVRMHAFLPNPAKFNRAFFSRILPIYRSG